MEPEEVEAFLNEEKAATLVTVKPNCAPHASIGSFSYNDGRLYFYSHKDSARQRNLKRNSHVAVTVIDEWRRQVILEGDAKILGTASELRSHEAADSFRMKYGDFAGNRESSSYIVEVTPDKILTYKAKDRINTDEHGKSSILETNELFILDSWKEPDDAAISIPGHIQDDDSVPKPGVSKH